MSLIVYTDGACKTGGSVGMGGWAWWVNDNLWDAGAVDDTTNNRMEILAIIQSLRHMATHYRDEDLLIVSDSAYVVNCFADGWYQSWRKNNWRNSAGKPVKNQDYWETLLDLFDNHPARVSFRHVRGHGRGGIADAPYVEGNHRADRLCVAARKTLERRHFDGYPSDPPIELPNWMA